MGTRVLNKILSKMKRHCKRGANCRQKEIARNGGVGDGARVRRGDLHGAKTLVGPNQATFTGEGGLLAYWEW